MVMSVGVLDGLELQSGTRRDARSWSSSDLGLHGGAVVVLQQQQQQGVREEMFAAEDEAEEQQRGREDPVRRQQKCGSRAEESRPWGER